MSLVVFASSVSYINSLEKKCYTCYSLPWTEDTMSVFVLPSRGGVGKGKKLSCFSIYITYSFIYILYFCSLSYSYSYMWTRGLFGEERIKQWENGCKTNFVRLWVAACQHICSWFYFCRVKPRWTIHTWGCWIGTVGVNLLTSASVCVYTHIFIYHEPHYQTYKGLLRYQKGWLPFRSRVWSYFKCIWGFFFKTPFIILLLLLEKKPNRCPQSILVCNLSQKN